MPTQKLTLPILVASFVLVFGFGACTLLAPSAYEGEVLNEADEMPELLPDTPTGIRAMQQSLRYPESAKEAGAEGRVLIAFVVDEEGQVTKAEVTEGVHDALNAEALRATQDLKFKPGQDGGEPVKVKLTLPFTFKLPADTTGTPPGQ